MKKRGRVPKRGPKAPPLHVTFEPDSGNPPGTRVTFSGVCPQVRLGGSGWSGSEERRSFEVGDPPFDQVYICEGPPTLLRALLDADTRAALLAFEPLVWDGVLKATIPYSALPVAARGGKPDVLAKLTFLASRLVEPSDVAERLARAFRMEKVKSARRADLRALAGDYPHHAATLAVLSEASRDSDPEVRLEAGIGRGADGQQLLLDLAEDESVPDGTAIEAIEALARACALGTIGHVTAESALLAALGRPETAVQVAAVRALGTVGGSGAVLPLREAAERDGSLRSAVGRAIAAIQERLPGGRGELALAEGSERAGQVSLSDDAFGRVSLDPATRPKS